MERPLIVFDVNETLLDLQHVTPILGRIFGDEGVMQLWFANLVLYSCALTLADHYVPFTDIGALADQRTAIARTADWRRRTPPR
jgi:2-haloacid dehalogenase